MKSVVNRLRSLCDDCLRAPANRHSNAPVGQEPMCGQCQLRWEAADEIEYLRDRVQELGIKYDGRLRELRQCEEDRRKAWMEIDELNG